MVNPPDEVVRHFDHGEVDELLEFAERYHRRVVSTASTDDAHMIHELLLACLYLRQELCHMGAMLYNCDKAKAGSSV